MARKVTVKLGFPADSLESVDNWRVVPSMKHSDVCCRPAGIMGGIPADQHLLWIDFTVSQEPSLVFFICGQGNVYQCSFKALGSLLRGLRDYAIS